MSLRESSLRPPVRQYDSNSSGGERRTYATRILSTEAHVEPLEDQAAESESLGSCKVNILAILDRSESFRNVHLDQPRVQFLPPIISIHRIRGEGKTHESIFDSDTRPPYFLQHTLLHSCLHPFFPLSHSRPLSLSPSSRPLQLGYDEVLG